MDPATIKLLTAQGKMPDRKEDGGMSSEWNKSYSGKRPEPRYIVVKCTLCGTEYTIVTNTPGCFYCPNCNSDRANVVGTEDFAFGGDA
jgi:hypothetical protein